MHSAPRGTDKQTYIRYWVYVTDLGICVSLSYATAAEPGNIVLGIDRNASPPTAYRKRA